LEGALACDPEERYSSTRLFAEGLERHIYQHGYGPTIQTLEGYMRERFPELYEFKKQ
jgi:hypothetical protein